MKPPSRKKPDAFSPALPAWKDSVHQIHTYAGVNAKVRALLSLLLDRRTFERLIDAPDAATAREILKGTDYRFPVEEAEAAGAGPEIIEPLLHAHLLSAGRKIEKTFPGRAEKNLIRLLLERAELERLKVSLRIWHRKTPDEAARYLPECAAGRVDFRAVAAAPGFDDIIGLLKNTPYRAPLEKIRGRFLEENSLFEVEMALDIDYYQRLLDAVARLSQTDRAVARTILGVEIDIENIRWLIRQRKYYSLGMGEMLEHIIPGGLRIDKEVVRQAYSTDGLAKVAASVALGPYAKVKDLVEENVHVLESFLQGILSAEVRKTLAGFPFTIGTVLGYLVLKEREVRNVISLLYGKYYGMKKEKISQLLLV